MDQPSQPPQPNQPPAQPPGAPVNHEHHVSNRRLKRRIMFSVIGLYVLSLAAASLILLRPAVPSKGKDGESILTLEKDSVGWVTIRGPIYNSAAGKPWERGSELWTRKIKTFAETKGIKAIVLDINSPGGSVGAVQEIYTQILRVRREQKIPVIALIGDVAASGGYYIAAACDKIVAHPGSLTGSIGVIFSVSNLEGLFTKVGYKADPIKSGPHKDIGSPARPMTKEERALLQDLINDAYAQFVDAVKAGRKIPEDKLAMVTDGRIFSGTQALSLGLVDVLGDSTDAAELAGRLGGISGKPKIKRETGEGIMGFWDLFAESRVSALLSGGALTELGQVRAALGGSSFSPLEYRWPGW